MAGDSASADSTHAGSPTASPSRRVAAAARAIGIAVRYTATALLLIVRTLRTRRRLLLFALAAVATFSVLTTLFLRRRGPNELPDRLRDGTESSIIVQPRPPLIPDAYTALSGHRMLASTAYGSCRVRAFNKVTIADLLDMCTKGAPTSPANMPLIDRQPLQLTRHFAGWESAGLNLTELYLSTCFPIEISTTQSGRSVGHCSDFVQYIYYANARLSSEFSDEVYKEKLRRCPESIYLHGEYPISFMFSARRPDGRPYKNYWMPNIEQIAEKHIPFFSEAHTIVAKTHITAKAISDFMAKRGIKGTTVKYMSHSSPDPLLSLQGIDYAQDFNRFFHGYGKSGRKHRNQIIDCWLENPDLPTLTLVGHHSFEELQEQHKETLDRLALPDSVYASDNRRKPFDNIRVVRMLAVEEFVPLAAAHGVHLCPSAQEGYGHYINLPRALSALVITTDHPPMNEFVRDGESGVLLPPNELAPEAYQLLQEVFVSPALLTADAVCAGVRRVLDMPIVDRRRLGRAGRAAYVEETLAMAANLRELVIDAVASILGDAGPPVWGWNDAVIYAESLEKDLEDVCAMSGR
ncbi:hypothetical protein HK405_003614 [Cladochytrium tenue]|nr:hypothetical protein HK405_003614 [Cladochytrium tenue]